MKRIAKYLLPPTLIVLAIGTVVILAKNRPAPEQREPTQAAMVVDVVYPVPSQGRFRVSAQGTVQPRTETSIVAEVAGTITEMSDAFVAGGFFSAGAVLARIDPSDYEAALLQAEAELASAKARLADEQARSDQARRDFERLHGSDREPNELVLRLPQLAGAKASVQAQEAAVLRARRNLERTLIRLPFDGLVKQRNVDLGQYVSTGTTLGAAFAVDIAEVRLPLSGRDLAFLNLPRPGQSPGESIPVTLSGMVSGEFGAWDGEIIRTEGVVDEATRLVYAVARINDPYGLLGAERSLPLPMGTFVQVEIAGRSAEGLMTLPRVALRDGDRVFLADGSDRLEIREVSVVRSTPLQVYVYNDLDTGDRVITTAIQAPVPGLGLRVREIESTDPQLRVLPAGELASREGAGEDGDGS